VVGELTAREAAIAPAPDTAIPHGRRHSHRVSERGGGHALRRRGSLIADLDADLSPPAGSWLPRLGLNNRLRNVGIKAQIEKPLREEIIE
jgi:hypothetical protein